MRFQRLSPEEEARRMRLYELGLTDGAIALELNMIRSTVESWRTSRGLPSNSHKYCEEPKPPRFIDEPDETILKALWRQRIKKVAVALRKEGPDE